MEDTYTFIYVPNREFNTFKKKDVAELLMKWSMKDNLRFQTYCFNQPFQTYRKNDLIEAFLKDQTVIASLDCFQQSWKPRVPACKSTPPPYGIAADTVEIKQVPCTVTSMSFFDPLLDSDNGIVRGDGWISKCMIYSIDGFEIYDELGKVLLDSESDNYDIFSEQDREQFIFHIFKHLCLGGKWCQYEDNINPYLETTKLIYKDLLRVHKDSTNKKLYISSLVFRVVARDKNGIAYFPFNPDNIQNFAYLIIDPPERKITTVTHNYGGNFSS
ncbi:cilia- and flagella-associated protein 300-like isoform X1 [Schistocerca americana]|uniref:cilia- and flagella-associated protein 300-like isoform X1 n=1 Tax=Schistocerca americana TaxID=7009 RepID=UPI001F4F1EA0|nr:cilia- and flagella-associated protein 300-like isoform X1 [Schistocerca americana]